MNPRCYSVCRQLQLHDPTAKLTSDFPREIQQSTRLTHIDYSLNWCHLKLTCRQLSEGQIRISKKMHRHKYCTCKVSLKGLDCLSKSSGYTAINAGSMDRLSVLFSVSCFVQWYNQRLHAVF